MVHLTEVLIDGSGGLRLHVKITELIFLDHSELQFCSIFIKSAHINSEY